MKRAAPFVLVLVALLGGCGSTDQDKTSSSQPTDPAAAPFERGRTLACLRRLGGSVTALKPADPELRALRDLAQRTAFQVRLDGRQVALAFGRDVAAAELLEELIAVPDSSYTTARRGNIVVLYRRDKPTALHFLADCLSP